MILSRMAWWLMILLAAALPLGCGAFDDDDDDNREPAQVQSKDDLPDDAEQVAAATGQDLNWRASADGRIYVLDRGNNKVIYTGKVRDDQRVKVDLSRGRVTVGDDTVLDRKLNDQHEYRIYFVEK